MNEQQLEQMGIELSQQLRWGGLSILRVASAALTDANFHDEAEVIEQMLKALESADSELKYTLTTSAK